jgi:hypothetical protein
MKRTINIFALLLFFSQSTVLAQLDLKLNIDNLIDRKPEFSIEAGSDKFSIELINGLIFKKWGESTVVDSQGNETEIGAKRFGYNGMLRANYYFNPRESLDGWHVSPYARYRYQNIKFEDPIINNRIGMGLIFGRKGLFNDRFGYQVEAGFGYWLVNKYKYKSTKEPADISQNVPIFGDLVKSLDKFDLPINIQVFYRIGGY